MPPRLRFACEQPFPFRIVSKKNGLGTATHSGVWTAHCTRQEMYNVFHAWRLIQDVVHHNQSAPTIDGHFEPKAVSSLGISDTEQ